MEQKIINQQMVEILKALNVSIQLVTWHKINKQHQKKYYLGKRKNYITIGIVLFIEFLCK